MKISNPPESLMVNINVSKKVALKAFKSYNKNLSVWNMPYDEGKMFLYKRTINNLDMLELYFDMKFDRVIIIPSPHNRNSYVITGKASNGAKFAYCRKETGHYAAGQTRLYSDKGQMMIATTLFNLRNLLNPGNLDISDFKEWLKNDINKYRELGFNINNESLFVMLL